MVSSVKADFSFKHQFNQPNILHRRKLPQLRIDATRIKEYINGRDPYQIKTHKYFIYKSEKEILIAELDRLVLIMQLRHRKWLNI